MPSAMLSVVLLVWVAAAHCLALQSGSDGQTPMRGKFDDDIKVPVVLGVMSACPDALLCESVFDRVLKRVGSKVDLSLTYIGQLNATEPDFGVNCKHGAVECAGNVQQLCAIKYLQTPAWWRFIQCQNFEGRYKVGLPETALKCAHAASLDWENSDVGQCAGADASGKGEEGIALLKESVQNATKIGVEKSCTILISGRPVCIRDETWKQCDGGHAPEDFIRQINEEYARLNN